MRANLELFIWHGVKETVTFRCVTKDMSVFLTTAPVPDEALRPIRISFEGDATVTPASTASVIGEAISERAALGVRRWLLVSAGDLADPRQSRATYVRIMGVRAVLMNLGVPGNAIEMRMENAGPPTTDSGDGAVLIEPLVTRNTGTSTPTGDQP